MNKRKTIHGIDLTAPGGIQALLDFHRCTFGDAQMNAGGGDGGEGGGAPAGSDPAGQAGTGTGDPAGTPTAGSPQATPAAVTVDPPAPGEGEGDPNPWDDPVKAKAEIERLQREAASAGGKARDTARAQAAQEARDTLVQDLGKALGLVKDGDPAPDADALTRQIAEKDTEARQAQVELAVYRSAAKAGADADALLDSRNFLAALDGVDPTDGEKITAAITDAVSKNPKLRTSQAAGRSGTELPGGSGNAPKKAGSLSEALTQHYSN